jgi:hypothetical protein
VTEVTRTDVTAVVPLEEQARRTAEAFDPATAPPSSRLADDDDAQTVVRPPMFTPGDYVAASGEAPVVHPPRMARTLRSLEAPAEVREALAQPPAPPQGDPPLEKTLPFVKAVPLAVVAPPTVTPPMGVYAAPLPAAAARALAPLGAPMLPGPPPPRRSVAVYVLVVGLAALLVSALLAWFVVRSLRP